MMLHIMKFVLDTGTVAPLAPTTGISLVYALIAVGATALGAFISTFYAKEKAILSTLDHGVQTAIIAIFTFGIVYVTKLAGVSQPSDVLGLDPTFFTALLSGLAGKLVTLLVPSATPAPVITPPSASLKK